MEFLSESIVVNAIIAVIFLTLLSALFVKQRYSYWLNKDIPYVAPSFPWGNAGDLMTQKKSFGHTFRDIYAEMKSKSRKHAGAYFLLFPQYIPIDPDLIKHIIQRDFHHFVDRGVYCNARDEPLMAKLFTMEGVKWKKFRSKLSPTFTSSKIKMMFPHIINACEELVDVLGKSPSGETLEITDLLARLTTDIIGTCAFGIECNSLKNPDAEFRKYGRLIFDQTVRMQITGFFTFVLPTLMKALGATLMRKEVNDFFMSAIEDTIRYRESGNVRRNDFMDLLLQIKNKGSIEDDDKPLTDATPMALEEVAGQAFVFFLAGFETSSITMSFSLYELACNEDIQEKLRQEILDIMGKHGGRLTYEMLSEMPYLDMVVNETLRKYPPVPVLNRICTKDYQIPGTNTILDKGVQVVISVEGLHHDPEYYPDPDVFDPDRFTDENCNKRHPYTFLPFGEGPRVCVGLRFGLLQVKVGLALLLKNYKFSIDARTRRPPRINPVTFLTNVVGGIWMKATKINA